MFYCLKFLEEYIWKHIIKSKTNMFLSAPQLYTLTRKKHCNAQALVLNTLGINYIKRPDGSLIVSELHVQQLLGAEANGVNLKKVDPDWSVINA